MSQENEPIKETEAEFRHRMRQEHLAGKLSDLIGKPPPAETLVVRMADDPRIFVSPTHGTFQVMLNDEGELRITRLDNRGGIAVKPSAGNSVMIISTR